MESKISAKVFCLIVLLVLANPSSNAFADTADSAKEAAKEVVNDAVDLATDAIKAPCYVVGAVFCCLGWGSELICGEDSTLTEVGDFIHDVPDAIDNGVRNALK